MDCAIAMDIDSESVGSSVEPLALETVAVLVLDLALAVDLVSPPLSLVSTVIGEGLRALSFAFAVDPLSGVGASGREGDGGQFLLVLPLNFCLDHLE